MAENGRNRMNIVLVGMPGSGKSTIGKLLAERLDYEFCDMDKYVEQISGRTIPQLFAISEDCFRDWETEACRRLSKRVRTVIAGGGGVVLRSENLEFLRRTGKILYLDRPISMIASDINTRTRPLLSQGIERLYTLYRDRVSLYQVAGETVPNDTTPDKTIEIICNKLKEYEV